MENDKKGDAFVSLITPLVKRFGKFTDGFVSALVEEAEREGFSDYAMSEGIRALGLKAKGRPSVEEVLNAVRGYEKPKQSTVPATIMPWESALTQANKLEWEYCQSFEKYSGAAKQAKDEGWWDRRLVDWITENARYQAQAIAGVKNGMRPSEHALQYPKTKEERKERELLCNHMRKQAIDTGRIDVSVPAWFYQQHTPSITNTQEARR